MPAVPGAGAPSGRDPSAAGREDRPGPGDAGAVLGAPNAFGGGTPAQPGDGAFGGAAPAFGAATGAAGLGAGALAATPPGDEAAEPPPVRYRGEEAARPGRLVQPLARAVSTVPTAMWLMIAALALLSAALAATTALAAARARRREATVREMETLAYTDSLTGVLNRGALEHALQRELARARRYERPMSILLFDVDGLKAVNDRHGHGAGDDLLRTVGATLSDTIRHHDICGRLGGDEYVVAVVEQDLAGAEQVRDRVAARIPARRAALGLATPWAVSVGAASYPDDGETVDDLLAAADRRLYLSRGIRIDREV